MLNGVFIELNFNFWLQIWHRQIHNPRRDTTHSKEMHQTRTTFARDVAAVGNGSGGHRHQIHSMVTALVIYYPYANTRAVN